MAFLLLRICNPELFYEADLQSAFVPLAIASAAADYKSAVPIVSDCKSERAYGKLIRAGGHTITNHDHGRSRHIIMIAIPHC